MSASTPAGPGEPAEITELARYLVELSRPLWRGAVDGPSPIPVPPVELEVTLNGGHNPNVARHYVDLLLQPGLPPDARILDLGCGYGRIALELSQRLTPGQRYTGLDPHAAAVDWAASNTRRIIRTARSSGSTSRAGSTTSTEPFERPTSASPSTTTASIWCS